MNYVLLVISCLLNGFKSVYAKKSNEVLTEAHNIYTYNFYMFAISFVIALAFAAWSFTVPSPLTLLLGALYGAVLIFAQLFLILAMKHGGVSVSMLFYSCGFLLPSFTGVLFYEETVSVPQLIGVALMLVSLLVSTSRGEKMTPKWFLFAVFAMLCNGGAGIAQKVFRMSAYKDQMSVFMMITFFVGALIAFLLMPKRKPFLPSGRFLRTVSVSGGALGFINIINVYISALLPSVVVFPSINGGAIIASSLMAYLMLGETLSKKKTVGIVLGVLAICLIAL